MEDAALRRFGRLTGLMGLGRGCNQGDLSPLIDRSALLHIGTYDIASLLPTRLVNTSRFWLTDPSTENDSLGCPVDVARASKGANGDRPLASYLNP